MAAAHESHTMRRLLFRACLGTVQGISRGLLDCRTALFVAGWFGETWANAAALDLDDGGGPSGRDRRPSIGLDVGREGGRGDDGSVCVCVYVLLILTSPSDSHELR